MRNELHQTGTWWGAAGNKMQSPPIQMQLGCWDMEQHIWHVMNKSSWLPHLQVALRSWQCQNDAITAPVSANSSCNSDGITQQWLQHNEDQCPIWWFKKLELHLDWASEVALVLMPQSRRASLLFTISLCPTCRETTYISKPTTKCIRMWS